MDSPKDINKNAAYNIIKNIFAILFPLVTFPYISRVLGTRNVGKVNFSLSVVSYFSLAATLGVETYAVRECARVKNSREELSRVAGQIYSVNIVSTAVAYLALAVTLRAVPSLLPYRRLIAIYSLNIVFATLGTGWLNTAVSDFKSITVRTVFMQAVSLALMMAFVRQSGDYYVYAWISVAAASGANLWNVLYRRKYCRIRFTLHMDARRHLPPILLLFSMVIAQTVFVNTDTTILGLYWGDFEVGLYGASSKIYNMVNMVVSSIAWVVMPRMSELFAARDYGQIKSLLKYSLNFIAVLGIPAIAGLNVLADGIIEVLAGKEYLGAVLSLRILTISLAFSFAGGFIGNMILLPSKREKAMLASNIVSALVNLALNLVLIPEFGLNAAAATTAIANAAGFVMGILFVRKEIRLQGLWGMFKAPLAGGLAIVAAVCVVKHFILNVYVSVFLSVAAGAVMYMLVLALLRDEFMANYCRQMKGRFARK